MKDRSFTTSFIVAATPEAVFAAVDDVPGWWSREIEGDTATQGGVFWYHFKDFHRCTIEITRQVPARRVDWHVLDCFFSVTEDET